MQREKTTWGNILLKEQILLYGVLKWPYPFQYRREKGQQTRSSLRWRISWKSQLSFWYGRWGGLVEKRSVRSLLEIQSLGNTSLGKCECDWYCDLWAAGVHLMINEVIPDLPRIVLGVHCDNCWILHKTKFGLNKWNRRWDPTNM